MTVIAITIPIIPKILPILEDSGWDRPLKAKINNNADNKYKIATMLDDIILFL